MKNGGPLIRAFLGDAHNFGRRVTLEETRILKPRTLLWEWLLLAGESPLRALLRAIGDSDAGRDLDPDPFGFLPNLAFASPLIPAGGEVERVVLQPLEAPSRAELRALAGVVGRALALFSWLGLSDLHWENLVLGRGDRDQIIFAPLDVEIILADLSLPTETKLLPDADPEVAVVCQHACGVRRVLPYLGKPISGEHLVTIAAAYLGTLALLDRNARAIARVFADLPGLRETPIRILLRGTDEYVRARTPRGAEHLDPPLLEAEREQLARGDIPYFFQLYGQAGIHYYASEDLTRIARLPLRGDVPRAAPVLRLASGLQSPSRTKLREEGLFTVIGAFDHPAIAGTYEDGDLAVKFGARSLVVNVRGGDELQTRRNLSAFVGSVYLPCSCGEVRSVFVPEVTACTLPARS